MCALSSFCFITPARMYPEGCVCSRCGLGRSDRALQPPVLVTAPTPVTQNMRSGLAANKRVCILHICIARHARSGGGAGICSASFLLLTVLTQQPHPTTTISKHPSLARRTTRCHPMRDAATAAAASCFTQTRSTPSAMERIAHSALTSCRPSSCRASSSQPCCWQSPWPCLPPSLLSAHTWAAKGR